jgi:hypothetical protein
MAHRGFKKPVSIEKMNNAIKQRRVKRGENWLRWIQTFWLEC